MLLTKVAIAFKSVAVFLNSSTLQSSNNSSFCCFVLWVLEIIGRCSVVYKFVTAFFLCFLVIFLFLSLSL